MHTDAVHLYVLKKRSTYLCVNFYFGISVSRFLRIRTNWRRLASLCIRARITCMCTCDEISYSTKLRICIVRLNNLYVSVCRKAFLSSNEMDYVRICIGCSVAGVRKFKG